MHLTRTDPETNLYRYYRLEVLKDLFGDWGLVREWGRIGSSGRVRRGFGRKWKHAHSQSFSYGNYARNFCTSQTIYIIEPRKECINLDLCTHAEGSIDT